MDNEVQALIMREYHDAVDEFGLTYKNYHESYAIILEEYEETIEEIHNIAEELRTLWTLVRDKQAGAADIKASLIRLENYSRFGLVELAQVAATAIKAQATCDDL